MQYLDLCTPALPAASSVWNLTVASRRAAGPSPIVISTSSHFEMRLDPLITPTGPDGLVAGGAVVRAPPPQRLFDALSFPISGEIEPDGWDAQRVGSEAEGETTGGCREIGELQSIDPAGTKSARRGPAFRWLGRRCRCWFARDTDRWFSDAATTNGVRTRWQRYPEDPRSCSGVPNSGVARRL